MSFLIGLLVLVSERKLWLRLIYYVLNSLVIFCVALGTNGVGTAASTKMALTSIISEAHAENNSSSEFSLLVALLNSKEERTKAIINLLNDVRNTSALNEKIQKRIDSYLITLHQQRGQIALAKANLQSTESELQVTVDDNSHINMLKDIDNEIKSIDTKALCLYFR